MAVTSLRLSLSNGFLLTAAVAIGGLHAAETPTAPKKSPFMAANAAAAPVAAASETIELAGVSSIGPRTDLIFYDKTLKKSRWVGIGDTVEGISVVSYDSRREEAVVKINGVQKTLALRKVTGTAHSSGPAPVTTLPAPGGFALPTHLAGAEPFRRIEAATAQTTPGAVPVQPSAQASAPAAPATPAQVAQQETDARMLVSDLLEIGMAQRKAYEEAHRRAALGAAPNAQPAQPAQPGLPGTTPATRQ